MPGTDKLSVSEHEKRFARYLKREECREKAELWSFIIIFVVLVAGMFAAFMVPAALSNDSGGGDVAPPPPTGGRPGDGGRGLRGVLSVQDTALNCFEMKSCQVDVTHEVHTSGTACMDLYTYIWRFDDSTVQYIQTEERSRNVEECGRSASTVNQSRAFPQEVIYVSGSRTPFIITTKHFIVSEFSSRMVKSPARVRHSLAQVLDHPT